MNNLIHNLDLQSKGVWFPLVIGAILLSIMLLMPKRQINWRGIYLTFGTVGFVGLVLDINILGTYFDWFDLGDPHKEGIGDLVCYGIIPPCLAVIFFNYISLKSKWLYVAFFTLISFLFEWELTQLGYMKLKGWQNWYSIPIYILIYGSWLPWHFGLIKKVRNGTIGRSDQDKQYDLCGMPNAKPAMKPVVNENNEEER